jgi:hypothetical protein
MHETRLVWPRMRLACWQRRVSHTRQA